jgi:hypothetical protein
MTTDDRRRTLIAAGRRRARLQRANGYRRLEAAVAERRGSRDPRPHQPLRGRAWINGCEVGGKNPRYEHLGGSHD